MSSIPTSLFNERRLMRQGALSAVKADEEVVPISEVKALKTRIRELERLLGRKTMEVEILKKALEVGREKNCYCACPYLKRTIPREDGYGDIGHFPVAPV